VSAKPLIRLESARQDEREAVAYYAREAGLDVALRFADALRDTYRSVGEQPGIGSPLYGNLLGTEGLRTRKLARFPYLVFYVEQEDHIDVWRVLHAQRDIPASLGTRTAAGPLGNPSELGAHNDLRQ
jgi:toxin ParE1/3/4